jgi:hypothetical protein
MNILKAIFHSVMIFLLTSSAFAVVWHFGDVYGTEWTCAMPLNLLFKFFLAYWGVKAFAILAGIYGFYWLIVAICRWFQSSLDSAVDKAYTKHLSKDKDKDEDESA